MNRVDKVGQQHVILALVIAKVLIESEDFCSFADTAPSENKEFPTYAA